MASFHKYSVILMLVIAVYSCSALHLKHKGKSIASGKDEWDIIGSRLGLTTKKVELLRRLKDQPGLMDLLKRFIRENPKHINIKVRNPKQKESSFMKIYGNLLKELKKSRRMLKTSLNIEFADKSSNHLKRSPRKIAVKMVSDMPVEQIDKLVKVFNQQQGIDSTDTEPEYKDNDSEYYNEPHPMAMPSDLDTGSVYENLYEDEQDLTAPTATNHNSEYGSIQDLILRARRNQWHHEGEETELRFHNDQNFS